MPAGRLIRTGKSRTYQVVHFKWILPQVVEPFDADAGIVDELPIPYADHPLSVEVGSVNRFIMPSTPLVALQKRQQALEVYSVGLLDPREFQRGQA